MASFGQSASGLIGLVLYNGFLEPRWKHDRTMAITLSEHVGRHAEHIAGMAGWNHVGIGSDLDGGLGLEESPAEIDTVAELRQLDAPSRPMPARRS
jgi:membrane dipeptidase